MAIADLGYRGLQSIGRSYVTDASLVDSSCHFTVTERATSWLPPVIQQFGGRAIDHRLLSLSQSTTHADVRRPLLQRRSNRVGRVGIVPQGAPECRGPRVPGKKIKTVFPLQRVKLLMDLQIFDCELQKKSVWRQDPL